MVFFYQVWTNILYGMTVESWNMGVPHISAEYEALGIKKKNPRLTRKNV